MGEQGAAGLAVRQRVVVEAPQERAFAVFTERIGDWWPLAGKSIGSAPAVTAAIEPRVGGRWYERAADGGECDWGRVLEWDPPHRVVLTWEISARWEPDPSTVSTVEVRFTAESATRTRVELEHRDLEAYGEQAEAMRALFEGDDAWLGVLEAFASAAGGAAAAGDSGASGSGTSDSGASGAGAAGAR